jgi:hypothetical protein
MAYQRDILLKDLRENVIEVVFQKVNGETRTMHCTLRKDFLPESYVNDEQQEREFHNSNANVLAVWDVKNRGWRSFRIESVEYAQVLDGYL